MRVARHKPEPVGIPEYERPECQLTGVDGNVFAVIGTVRNCLRDAGFSEKADEFVERAQKSKSYDNVLALCFDYVDVL